VEVSSESLLVIPLTDGNLRRWRVAVAPGEENGLSEAGDEVREIASAQYLCNVPCFAPSVRATCTMKLKVIVHEAEEGGYWAEVPAIPGCATQGDTFEELLANLYDAVEGGLAVDVKEIAIQDTDRVLEIAD
jgi:predicted RNase H-like HicB family nuclease